MRLVMSHRLLKSLQLLAVSSYLGSCVNQGRSSDNLLHRTIKSLVPYQVTLQEDKVFRVPLECRELRILSGVAWLTVDGEDIIVTSGKTASLTSTKSLAVLSVLGNMPLTVEVL